MGIFRSKPKKPIRPERKERQVTPHDRAVLDLKVQRDKLKQYQKKLIVVREREMEIARQLLAEGRKDRALVALRKKKYQEQLLAKTDQMLLNVEDMVNSIEFAQVEVKVLDNIKLGNEALKEIQSEMSIDKVEQLLAESAEAAAHQQEISDMLAGKLTAEDDADVEAQLAHLEAEVLKEELPSVPTEPVAGATEAEADGEEDAPVTEATIATSASTATSTVAASAARHKQAVPAS